MLTSKGEPEYAQLADILFSSDLSYGHRTPCVHTRVGHKHSESTWTARQERMGGFNKSHRGSVLCTRGLIGLARHSYWGEFVARIHCERRENYACT